MKNYLENEIEEIHNIILRSIGQHLVPYLVRLKGIEYVIFPETFNPHYAKGSLLLLDNLGVRDGDVVLDPFTGCGADAIFAVLQGASRAVAIDKFTMPVLCARYNAYRLGLEDKVDVRQGNLFEALKPDEKFDLVIANPPFARRQSHTDIEHAIMDEEYSTLKRFWNGVSKHLKKDGRIRAIFSNIGDMKYFHSLAKKNGFVHETITKDKYNHVILEVYSFRKK